MRRSGVVVPIIAFLCTGQIALAEPFVLGASIAHGPVEVQANFRLLDINDIDLEAETFEVSVILPASHTLR
jgi:hypothetical protein